MTDTTPTHPTARAEFESLVAAYARCGDDMVYYNIVCDLAELVYTHRAVIAAALPADTAPDTLPDDWRPRPDANGD